MNEAVVNAAPDAGAERGAPLAPPLSLRGVQGSAEARHAGPLTLAVGAIGVVFGSINCMSMAL